MKKSLCLFAVTLLLTLSAITCTAAALTTDPSAKEVIAAMTPEQKQARLATIKLRIAEIKAIDKSELTKPERRELRTELKSLRKQEFDMVGFLYISVGAVIFIAVILLIVLK